MANIGVIGAGSWGIALSVLISNCFEGLSVYLNPVGMYEPTPQVWKAEMGVTSDKETSIRLAEKLFGVSLKKFLDKGKVDDIAEALLLSVYGFKKYYDSGKEN